MGIFHPRCFGQYHQTNPIFIPAFSSVFIIDFLRWWRLPLHAFSMSASNERDWNPEVAQMLDYRLDRDGNTLTISNVRNFDWQDKTHFQPRWETRQYDLAKLQTVDFIASYWMGDAIAHTLVSFGLVMESSLRYLSRFAKKSMNNLVRWVDFFASLNW